MHQRLVNTTARPELRRTARIAAAGQGLLAALMVFAAVDSSDADRSMFWALAACAALGAVSAVLLSTVDRRTAQATNRVNQAVVAVGVGFCVGALAAVFGGNPLVLAVPVLLVLVNAMLIGAARKLQTGPLPG